MVGYTFSEDDTLKNTDLACYRWEWESVFFFFFFLSDLQAFKKNFILYYSRVGLQCCASFRCSKVIQLHIYMRLFFFKLFSRLGYYSIE